MLKTGYLSVDYTQGDITTYKGIVASVNEAGTEIRQQTFFTGDVKEDKDNASDWLLIEQNCYAVFGTKSFKEFHKEVSITQKNNIVYFARYTGKTIPGSFAFGEIYKVVYIENITAKFDPFLSIEEAFQETEPVTSIWHIINEKDEIERKENVAHNFAIIPQGKPELVFKNDNTDKIDSVLEFAIDKKTSDISIIPYQKGSLFLIKFNGQLFECSDAFTKSQEEIQQLAVRIKTKCNEVINPFDNTRPTIGSFLFTTEDIKIDVRVSTIPTSWGEKINIRLIPS